MLYCTIGGALINITLNLALIPLLSQNGTAVASVASETFVTATTAWFASKTLSFGIRKNVIWKTVVSTLIMTIIVEVFNFVIKNVFFSFYNLCAHGRSIIPLVVGDAQESNSELYSQCA
uniref:polysaccharide biosynthesis C-terminal domain-containing protein n=1 Tax=Bifidobacterium animalis TaxID=28025 RepID=UPI00209AC219|nr:polysaccharide biosynthesis C-terminal domain-containing protein [Bifidobacterium animalis]